MGLPLTTRALLYCWSILLACVDARGQVSELSTEEQRELLGKALDNCRAEMNRTPVELPGVFCSRTWDNVMCWPDTPAGTTRFLPCPAYINRFDQAEYATKRCMENGSWYVHPEFGTPYTFFNACITAAEKEPLHDLIVEHMKKVKLMYTIGYSMSLTALILAVAIMVYFRRLHCPRNMIHLNMFLAFLVRAAFSLMKNVLLVEDLGFPNDVNNTGKRIEFIQEGTHWECKLFFTLFYYVIFASVMWLFNEGLYLVLILCLSVFAERTRVRWFVLNGWGFPLIFVVAWVVCRIKLDDMLCWNVHRYKELYWILHGPMIGSVGINFIFFIIIIRILCTKLSASNCPESKNSRAKYRKLAKSTLILIPLFAVYYMGFMWMPDNLTPEAEIIKLYVEMLFNSFQGFLVALLFCFLNTEVQNEIRKKWQRNVLRRTGSWRSQPSIGSFLRHSTKKNDKNNRIGRLHSRSTGDSEDANCHFRTMHTLVSTNCNKANGHLTTICEESSFLNDVGRETCAQVCRQDHNENRKSYVNSDSDYVSKDKDDVFECNGEQLMMDTLKTDSSSR